MALFRRRSRFPADILERLDVLGRYEMDPMTSGVDGKDTYQLVVRYHDEARADPEGFTGELHDLVAEDTSGFVVYGASRLVWDIWSDFPTSAALAILDAAIAFKRELGHSTFLLAGYERDRWYEQHGPRAW